MTRKLEAKSRREMAYELADDGLTLQAIGDCLGVSRQRVQQILKARPDLEAIRVEAKEQQMEVRAEEGRREHRRKYGSRSRKEFYDDLTLSHQRRRLLAKKANSKRPGLLFDLQHGDLEWPVVCPVLGIPLDYAASAGKRAENSASFDRLDSTVGYTKDNTRIISWRANRIKNDGTADEHRRIAEYIDRVW